MEHWQTEYSVETSAKPESIWHVLRDVRRWPEWNAGIEHIELEGPFASGTWFRMTPPGQEPVHSMLTDVRENECFVDETRVEGLLIRVIHRISETADGRRCITYIVEARGPEAATIGPMVSADFPEVLAALATRAEAHHA